MRALKLVVAVALLCGAALPIGVTPAAAADESVLSAAQQKDLGAAKYVYIQSTRKDGSLSKPAEIWFLFHDGAVWVGTTPQSWRAKRIQAGRPRARIAIGKLDNEPFFANGEIVKDATAQELMLKTYADKYPDGWSRYAEKFRTGFQDGSRILIRYTPVR